MNDVLHDTINKFNEHRDKHPKFFGTYRALVIDTNDPLNVGRVRFNCPDLHDSNIDPADCPWAVPAFDFGSKGSGAWSSLSKGDVIWVAFEKGHPYGPVWLGAATPTKRAFYPISAVHTVTPLPVDAKSNVAGREVDYQERYLPGDRRPMTDGRQDRYGNLELLNSTGFFPIEHAVSPVPVGVDPATGAAFEKGEKPQINSPDQKYMLRATKYGNIVVQSDVGYLWNNEFSGDFDKDRKFEISRWNYIRNAISDKDVYGADQRRILMLTRYGHKIEMKDVGYNINRSGEYGTSGSIIGNGDDQRWIKIRTKGGHLFQLIDVGTDPVNDEYVKRSTIADNDSDSESDFGDDARCIRMVSRSGIKLAMDDRGANTTNASSADLPNKELGRGFLIKARSTPAASEAYPDASGNPRGHYFQIDQRVDANNTTWGTSSGLSVELNDNNQSIIMCTRLPELPTAWQNVKDNEFLNSSVFDLAPNISTHHLILDHQNEMIRLKSRAGRGAGPLEPKVEAFSGVQAGLEIHDNSDNTWVEVNDHEDRGLWFSSTQGTTILRAKHGKTIQIMIDDSDNKVIVTNNHGKIQITANGNIDFIGGADMNINLEGDLNIKAKSIKMDCGGKVTIGDGAIDAGMDIKGHNIYGYYPQIRQGIGPPPGAHIGVGKVVTPVEPDALPALSGPTDRE